MELVTGTSNSKTSFGPGGGDTRNHTLRTVVKRAKVNSMRRGSM